MLFNIYAVFYSQCSCQHVSADIPAVFSWHHYENTNVQIGQPCRHHYTIIKIIILVKIM